MVRRGLQSVISDHLHVLTARAISMSRSRNGTGVLALSCRPIFSTDPDGVEPGGLASPVTVVALVHTAGQTEAVCLDPTTCGWGPAEAMSIPGLGILGVLQHTSVSPNRSQRRGKAAPIISEGVKSGMAWTALEVPPPALAWRMANHGEGSSVEPGVPLRPPDVHTCNAGVDTRRLDEECGDHQSRRRNATM